MSTQPDHKPVPFDLDDVEVERALLLVYANGVLSGFASALTNTGVLPERQAARAALHFVQRVHRDPVVRETILSGLRRALTEPGYFEALPPLDLA